MQESDFFDGIEPQNNAVTMQQRIANNAASKTGKSRRSRGKKLQETDVDIGVDEGIALMGSGLVRVVVVDFELTFLLLLLLEVHKQCNERRSGEQPIPLRRINKICQNTPKHLDSHIYTTH